MKLTEVQEQWLQALESGKYIKSVKYLASRMRSKDVTEYCCLGVACEMFHKQLDIKKYETSYPNMPEWDFTSYDISMFSLSKKMVEHLGLHDATGGFIDPETGKPITLCFEDDVVSHVCLADINDIAAYDHKDFKQMARFIRDNAIYIFRQTASTV